MPVKELVLYEVGEEYLKEEGMVHLDAESYHEKLASEDTVVINVRNHYTAAMD